MVAYYAFIYIQYQNKNKKFYKKIIVVKFNQVDILRVTNNIELEKICNDFDKGIGKTYRNMDDVIKGQQ